MIKKTNNFLPRKTRKDTEIKEKLNIESTQKWGVSFGIAQ